MQEEIKKKADKMSAFQDRLFSRRTKKPIGCGFHL